MDFEKEKKNVENISAFPSYQNLEINMPSMNYPSNSEEFCKGHLENSEDFSNKIDGVMSATQIMSIKGNGSVNKDSQYLKTSMDRLNRTTMTTATTIFLWLISKFAFLISASKNLGCFIFGESFTKKKVDGRKNYKKIGQELLKGRKSSTETSVFSYSIVPPELVLSGCINSTQDLSKYQESKKTFRSALPEIFASCTATSFHLMVGVTFACTSSLMPQLEDPESDIKATKSELAWIASVIFVVIPFTSVFVGFFMEHFGRLNAVKLAAIPSVASCILIALSTDAYMIIGGRLLFGIGTALGTNPAIVYVTEITSAEYRGALISSGPTLSSLGMMIGYVMGAFLPWRIVSWINISYCLIPVILMMFLFIPESPAWLVSKDRIEQARDSLIWFSRCEDETKREKIVERKLKELMKDKEEKLAATRGRPSFWRKFAGLKKPTGYKPMVIMIVLFFLQQYTGVYITTFYIVQYFEAAGSKMNPFHASILVGLTRLVMSLVTVYLLKRFGRRPLCITSSIGMGISVAVSGYYTHQVIITGESLMMPVYTILIFIAFSMIGLLSLPWTMAAEVFPTEIRGISHGIVMACAHSFMFISLQSYYGMAEFFGGHDGLQWFFAVMCIFTIVFIYFFLPETHRKTLIEIENYFEEHTVYFKSEIKNSEVKKSQKERKFSPKTLSMMEVLPENMSECDTLVKQLQNNYPKVIKEDLNIIGDTDVRSLDYIDKNEMELDRISRV